MKPVIGITLDWKESGSFADRPFYAMEQYYFEAITAAGGIPIGIPSYEEHDIQDYIKRIDGLLSPGGNFAYPASWYIGDDAKSSYGHSPRAQFDIELIKSVLDIRKPVLGICAGMQMIGGSFGCKITHDVHEYLDTDINHLKGKPIDEFAYTVDIKENTLLHSIINTDLLPVNSSHQEAIVDVPDNVIINAISIDKCIQGIEIKDYPFALGVQWHPEIFINSAEETGHRKIFEAFLEAC